jgi:hypothetical protein
MAQTTSRRAIDSHRRHPFPVSVFQAFGQFEAGFPRFRNRQDENEIQSCRISRKPTCKTWKINALDLRKSEAVTCVDPARPSNRIGTEYASKCHGRVLSPAIRKDFFLTLVVERRMK